MKCVNCQTEYSRSEGSCPNCRHPPMGVDWRGVVAAAMALSGVVLGGWILLLRERLRNTRTTP